MRRTTALIVSCLMLTAWSLTAGTVSATAHDQLIASNPAANERLERAPSSITLDYSAEVLTLGGAISVLDDAGRDWAVGEPEYDGTQVSVAVEPGMPEAGYLIRWRVVSSDGHPIAGVIPFTVGEGEPLPRESAPAVTEEPVDSVVEPEESQEQSPYSVWRTVVTGAVGAMTAGLAFAVATALNRRRETPVGTGPPDVEGEDRPHTTMKEKRE